jgi:hypothetical protein
MAPHSSLQAALIPPAAPSTSGNSLSVSVIKVIDDVSATPSKKQKLANIAQSPAAK